MLATPDEAIVFRPNLFTVHEAAWASDTEDTFVNREVDKKVVQINEGHRMLANWDVHYLCAMKDFAKSIDVELRKRIYIAVRDAMKKGNYNRVNFGPFVLRLKAVSICVNKRVADIDAARATIQQNPSICGGEPVIRGTRISIRVLGELARAGTGLGEIAKEYELEKRQIELALLYDRLHPRRGRPSLNPKEFGFSNLGVIERSEIEEIGEYPSRELYPPG